jgi:hypothetical protein
LHVELVLHAWVEIFQWLFSAVPLQSPSMDLGSPVGD